MLASEDPLKDKTRLFLNEMNNIDKTKFEHFTKKLNLQNFNNLSHETIQRNQFAKVSYLNLNLCTPCQSG